MIRRILVPTDGSDHADKALDLAADLAAKYEANVVVLHVLLHHTSVFELRSLSERLGADPALTARLDELEKATIDAASAAYDGPVAIPAPKDVLEAVGTLICDRARTRVEAGGVGSVVCHVVDGAPADCILGAADHEDADMIVMGSRGLGKIAGLLMGSVSHKVSHLSKCTCVTVR